MSAVRTNVARATNLGDRPSNNIDSGKRFGGPECYCNSCKRLYAGWAKAWQRRMRWCATDAGWRVPRSPLLMALQVWELGFYDGISYFARGARTLSVLRHPLFIPGKRSVRRY